jgi:hypothetical protein
MVNQMGIGFLYKIISIHTCTCTYVHTIHNVIFLMTYFRRAFPFEKQPIFLIKPLTFLINRILSKLHTSVCVIIEKLTESELENIKHMNKKYEFKLEMIN